ncbi:MAG: ferritin-like domain-containing protein [Burkholderiaceae bacterium]
MTTPTLREQALLIVLTPDAVDKARRAGELARAGLPIAADQHLDEPEGLPGRPPHPVLVPFEALPTRSMATREGHAALIHSVAHIELNAIDLALDAAWRFAGLPDAYYRDWLRVAAEEALHFTLLREHLLRMGFDYGSFAAHHGLWAMAERTRDDVMARMALVPRTLEARGLDASPGVRRKLVGVGDQDGAAIIDRILRDEVGHVAIGNHWYRALCAQRGLDPLATYDALARRYRAPRLKGPFNRQARRRAGFTDAELDALERDARAGAAGAPPGTSAPE